jgi:hypothetical protein
MNLRLASIAIAVCNFASESSASSSAFLKDEGVAAISQVARVLEVNFTE